MSDFLANIAVMNRNDCPPVQEQQEFMSPTSPTYDPCSPQPWRIRDRDQEDETTNDEGDDNGDDQGNPDFDSLSDVNSASDLGSVQSSPAIIHVAPRTVMEHHVDNRERCQVNYSRRYCQMLWLSTGTQRLMPVQGENGKVYIEFPSMELGRATAEILANHFVEVGSQAIQREIIGKCRSHRSQYPSDARDW